MTTTMPDAGGIDREHWEAVKRAWGALDNELGRVPFPAYRLFNYGSLLEDYGRQLRDYTGGDPGCRLGCQMLQIGEAMVRDGQEGEDFWDRLQGFMMALGHAVNNADSTGRMPR